MKKIIYSSIVIGILLLVFSSCSNNEKDKLTLISNNENYEVYEYCYSQFTSDYFFFVFDNKGEKIDAGYCKEHLPSIKKVSDFTLEYSISFGTNASEYKYYDVDKGISSETFQNVYYYQDNMIAYVEYIGNIAYICYKGVFDESLLLKEKLDMDGIMTTQFEVSVGNNVLYVTHAKGNEYKEITEEYIIVRNN